MERRELVEYEGGTRIVSLTPEAVELLRLEHAKHPRSPLMFMHPATQRPYSPQMVRRLHNEIIQEAGAGSHPVRRPPATPCARPVAEKRNGHEGGFSDAGPLQDRNDTTKLCPLPGQPSYQGREHIRRSVSGGTAAAGDILITS